MTDITPQQYEEVLTYLVDVQQQYPDMLVRARCAPHFKRIAYERDPNSPITKATGYMGGGCLAGTNYARVTPEGNLTPCPYMPLSAGNVREVSFVDLWERSEVFDSFREPKLKGKCADCEYSDICGGCRARPYADHGDWLDADEWCLYTPKGGPKVKVNEIGVDTTPEKFEVRWSDEATARFKRIPYFMQAMVKKSVEAKARERGLSVITPEFMEELRKARFGNEKPVFRF
jgi:radical SAM protein with 4Fe4S-binding SPASM domain